MYLLGLKKNYSNLKITGYIKAIFFCVWTYSLFENLLITKFISAASGLPESWENSVICFMIAVVWSCSNSVIWYWSLIKVRNVLYWAHPVGIYLLKTNNGYMSEQYVKFLNNKDTRMTRSATFKKSVIKKRLWNNVFLVR